MLRRLLPIASLCALVLPATAVAAFPGANGSLVFDRGGSLLAAPSLTLSAGGQDFAPTVSPDGARIAFAINRDVWVMNADGSGKRRLTADSASYSDPAWSPDGKRLAFSGLSGGSSEIFVQALAGGVATPLTATPDHDESQPAFAPDGGRIAYTRTGCEISHGGGTCVYVMPASGGAPANLTPEDHVPGCESQAGYFFDGSSREPAWSPDGRRIAFSGPLLCEVSSVGKDIWVMNADGSGKTDITHDDGTVDIEPAFSPSGAEIAFARNTNSGPTSIYVAAGASVTQVTTGDRDRRPDWGVAPKHCVVPKLKKATLADARARLPLMGCKLGTVTRKKTKAAKGTVVAQAVKPGTVAKLGTKVALTVDR